MSIQNKNTNNSNDLFQLVVNRFLPFWPYLLLFITISFIGAFIYLRIATPSYEATAIILVKDEKKGSDDSRMIDALNVFHSKKIVENEIEVIRSRTLMKEVVKSLRLYAPIYMVSRVRTLSAYTTTPVNIAIKDPDEIIESDKIFFTYDDKNQRVKIGNLSYSIGKWEDTPYGELMFTINNKWANRTQNILYFTLVPVKKEVNFMLTKLNVAATNKLSSVVTLEFIDEVPERAEDILNSLIVEYNRAGINDKNSLADNTMQFVDERLIHVKIEIDSIERRIQQYRSEEGVINLSQQGSLFLQNVGDNDQRSAVIQMQQAVLDQVQKYINSGKSNGSIIPSTLGIEDPALSQQLSQLSTSELEYEKLKNTTAENNPVLVSLSNQIGQLRLNILENIRIQKINLKASKEQLIETNKKYAGVLQALPEKERKLLEISREQTIINNVYNFLLQKKEETALSYASTVPDSRVLDTAEASIKPISPKKTIAFAVALFLGFFMTFATIYIKDFSGNKILFRSELEELINFKVIGEIAYFKKNLNENKKAELIKKQFLKMIASIDLINRTNSIKKILITSSFAGEGKSFIALNLAKVLAEVGKKVVLVDLDLKKASISNSFNSDSAEGITEYLMYKKEIADIIQSTEYTNISVVKSGEHQSNEVALFSNGRIDDFFSHLSHSFDFIIIDSSPIDPITDNLIASQFCDFGLYVTRHAFTPKSLLKFQIMDKTFLNSDKMGVVFNAIKPRGFMKGYGYGYGNENLHK
jgi:tyrosine-protein kinase Etk/Wzc